MSNKYYLISKNIGQKFINYKGDSVKLSGNIPYYVDEIVVGIRGQAEKTRKITTFRDSNGKLIERAFDYFDKPYRNVIYSTEDNILGQDNFVTSTTMRSYLIERPLMKVYKETREFFRIHRKATALWEPESIITNHLCENVENGNKVLSQVSITNLRKPSNNIHTYIEFPHIENGKRTNMVKKLLSFVVNSKKHELNPKGLVHEEGGIKIPAKDTFLAIRALPVEDMKQTITEMFLKRRKLKDKEITIYPNYLPHNERDEKSLTAFFSWSDGSINFNKHHKFISKSKLLHAIRHEVEHAWQFYIDARNTHGARSEWQEYIFKKFGIIRNKTLKAEADKYTYAIDNYVPYHKDYNLYKNNYIEVMANKAGQKVSETYDLEGTSIRNSFPYIPQELL